MNVKDVLIYGAGKTWAAPTLKGLRDIFGLNIISRWIDAEQILATPDSEHPPEVHTNEQFKRDIWENGCREDCLIADMGLLICQPEDGEKHSGSLVELGHITAFGKPVYILGTCASVEPVGHSDRAWKAQSNVYHWPEYMGNIAKVANGATLAVAHYINHYETQWKYRRISGALRENYAAMFIDNPAQKRNF